MFVNELCLLVKLRLVIVCEDIDLVIHSFISLPYNSNENVEHNDQNQPLVDYPHKPNDTNHCPTSLVVTICGY